MAFFPKIGSFYYGLDRYTPDMGECVKAVLHEDKWRMSAIVGIKHDALVTSEELTSTDARRYAAGYAKRARTDLDISNRYYELADRLQRVEEQDEGSPD